MAKNASPEQKRKWNAAWRARNPERAARLARERTRRYKEKHRDELNAQRRKDRPRGKIRPHLTEAEKSKIRVLYASGLNFKEIADATGRRGGTVSRLLRETHNIERPVRSGPKSPGWRGGRVLSHGYVYVWLAPDDPMACMRDAAGRVAEHRLALARKLGRPLLEHETVHHIDGNRAHNQPKNLQLRQGKHGTGVVMCCMDCGSNRIAHVEIASVQIDEKEGSSGRF